MHDDGLDLPSLEIVEFGFGFYCDCKMAVFQGIHYLSISISSLISLLISLLIILSILYYDCIDLPELHTMRFGYNAFRGNNPNPRSNNTHFKNAIYMRRMYYYETVLKINMIVLISISISFVSFIDLPKLTLMESIKEGNFINIGIVHLRGMP